MTTSAYDRPIERENYLPWENRARRVELRLDWNWRAGRVEIFRGTRRIKDVSTVKELSRYILGYEAALAACREELHELVAGGTQ